MKTTATDELHNEINPLRYVQGVQDAAHHNGYAKECAEGSERYFLRKSAWEESIDHRRGRQCQEHIFELAQLYGEDILQVSLNAVSLRALLTCPRWPVIIFIVVVSLIVLSIAWCIIRCACCGMSCCCTCFSFLKCCDCCGGCCDGKKDKPMKHLDEPYAPRQGFQNQGYQAPAPMMGGGLGGKAEPAQFATFEVGKSGLAVDPKQSSLSEDALPPMPSWDSAAKKHVLTEEEKNAVELGELDPATGQKIPLMTNAGSPAIGGPPSPAHDVSTYGLRPGQGNGVNGYMGVAAGDLYAPPTAYNQNGFRGSPSPGPGRGIGGASRGYGQVSPTDQGRGMGGRGYGQESPMDGQGRGFPLSPQDPYANDGFSGTATGYGRSQPQRQNSNDTYGSRQYPPQPQRQYSDDSSRPLNPGRQYSDQPYGSDNFQPSGPPRGPSRGPGPRGPAQMASPPLANDSGFDFGSPVQQPYSRPSPPPQQSSYRSRPSPPQQGGYLGGSTAPPSYASRSPPSEEPSYPGYRAYQAPSQRNMTPGRRGREPPQNWDPVQR